eukprot:gene31880-biopygen30544
MDRIDAMKVFIAALDEGSLAGAGRLLGRSPAAVSRAVAFLEQQAGAPLLHRTTRSIRLSETGERYADLCRRVLADLQELEAVGTGERTAPRGTLTITAPPISGEEILRPIIDAFVEAHPAVTVNLVLLVRLANLVEEGIDIALRIAAAARGAVQMDRNRRQRSGIIDRVEAGAAIHGIGTAAADQRIVAIIAIEHVIAAAARNEIVT